MKRKAISLILAILPIFALATSEQTMEQGNKAYEQKQYREAIDAYETVINEGYHSADLFYNLGNAYFRQGELAKSILWYERALRLDPKDTEIQENLEFAQSKTLDKIEVIPELVFVRWFHGIVEIFSPTGWMIATLILLAFGLAALTILVLGRSFQARKWSLIVLIAAGVLSICGGINATISQHEVSSKSEAIVMPTMISVKSSPDAGSVEKFILHSGTKVGIDEEVNGWLKISISNGDKGWISETETERI